MEYRIQRLQQLLDKGKAYMTKTSETSLSKKKNPDKWSKKEILGHLVDSGINNLQRFTEIQYKEKPFIIENYDQDQLVRANAYQYATKEEILNFWLTINARIIAVIQQQTEQTLNYQIIIGQKVKTDLKFLIEDYVDHMEHHLRQIYADHVVN